MSPKSSYLWTKIRLSFCSVPEFIALLRGIVRVCVVVGSFICCLRFSDRGCITLIKNLLLQIIDCSCLFFLAQNSWLHLLMLASTDAVKSFVFPDRKQRSRQLKVTAVRHSKKIWQCLQSPITKSVSLFLVLHHTKITVVFIILVTFPFLFQSSRPPRFTLTKEKSKN